MHPHRYAESLTDRSLYATFIKKEKKRGEKPISAELKLKLRLSLAIIQLKNKEFSSIIYELFSKVINQNRIILLPNPLSNFVSLSLSQKWFYRQINGLNLRLNWEREYRKRTWDFLKNNSKIFYLLLMMQRSTRLS